MRLIYGISVLTLVLALPVAAQESESLKASLYVGGGTELFGFRDNTTLAWPWYVQIGAMWSRDQSPVAFRVSAVYAERILGSDFQSFGIMGEALRELGKGLTNPYIGVGAGLFRNRLTGQAGGLSRVLTPGISLGVGVTRHLGRGAFFVELRHTGFLDDGDVTWGVLPLTFGFRF
jgi:hypothetical protein